MSHPTLSWRSFLRTSAALAGSLPLAGCLVQTDPQAPSGSRIAYVGTFSSPLRNMLPTQVDLPPGNGRGIHLFEIDRSTGAMSPSGVVELGNSPNCLVVDAAAARLYSTNETDHVGEASEGSVSAFAINRADGQLTLL